MAGRLEVELAYVIAPAARGRGLATEAGRAIRDHALTGLGCRRLVALIHPENAGSERVAVKLDFRHEGEVDRPQGRLRHYAFTAAGPPKPAILQNNPMHQKITVVFQ